MSFQKRSEFRENWNDEISSGQLEDCESVCLQKYMLAALKMRAFFL